MTQNPFISVIIVTYNRKSEVKRALQSVLNQDYHPFEILVVDNGSEDGTGEMIHTQFPQVIYLFSPINLGCPEGRNMGIRKARGEWLFFLDDDAWCGEDLLAKAVERIQQCDSKTMVVMPQIQEWIDGKWVLRFTAREGVNIAGFSGGVSLIHKKVFREFGPYPNTLYGAEEKYIAVQILSKQYKIVLDPSIVVYHKPSNYRSPDRLFQLKIMNDFLWVIRFSPLWMVFPSLFVKTVQWSKAGIGKGFYRASIKGLVTGWASLYKIFGKNNRLTLRQYLSYIRTRKKVKIYYTD